jgi:hypothetical protein
VDPELPSLFKQALAIALCFPRYLHGNILPCSIIFYIRQPKPVWPRPINDILIGPKSRTCFHVTRWYTYTRAVMVVERSFLLRSLRFPIFLSLVFSKLYCSVCLPQLLTTMYSFPFIAAFLGSPVACPRFRYLLFRSFHSFEQA